VLKQHPLSAAFPAMSAEEFAALVQDMKANGQLEPIVRFESMALDGWHRSRACEQLGATPKTVEYQGDDPVSFVLSRNLHRRHLTLSQRAAAIVACAEWRGRGKPAAKPEPGSGLSEREMARMAGTSDRTIRDAKVAHKAGLTEAVKDGALTVKEAAAVARGKTGAPNEKARSPKRDKQEPGDLATQLESSREQLNAVQKQTAALVTALEESQREAVAGSTRYEELSARARAEAEAAKSQSEREASEHANQVRTLQQEIQSLEQRVLEHKGDADRANQELARVTSELAAARSEVEQVRSELAATLEKLQAALGDRDMAREQLQHAHGRGGPGAANDALNALLDAAFDITEEQWESLLHDRPWFRLPNGLDELVSHHNEGAERCSRIDILTWAYRKEGLIGFNQVWECLTGYPDARAKRKVAIRMLELMLKQELLTRMHFSADAPKKDPGGMNDGTAFEIAPRGMVYLLGAWTARQRLAARGVHPRNAHAILCEEEDGNRAHELHYVRSVVVVDAALKPVDKPKYVTSVFGLAR
jgi:hypothetical protein